MVSKVMAGIAAFGLLVLIVSGITWVMWRAPELLTQGDFQTHAARTAAANAARQPLATSLLAFGATLTALFTVANYFLSRRNSERDHQLAREAQVTDRYSDAVSHLGASGLHVRLGGVYALQRIGLDFDRDRLTVISVLSAFVRDPPRRDAAAEADAAARSMTTRVHADVLAAVEALTSLQAPDDPGLNLVGADLSGLELKGLPMRAARLGSAMLDAVDATGAVMSEANLEKARLRGAVLRDAVLTGARLDGAHVHGAVFAGAHVEGADFREALGLTVEQVRSMHRDQSTLLPSALRAAVGSERDDAQGTGDS